MDPKSDKFAQIRLQIKTSPRYCVILILGSICQAALLIVDWFASHKAESLVRPHLENWNLSAEAFASWLLDGARYYYLPGFSFAHNCSTESYYQMFSPLDNSSRIYFLSLSSFCSFQSKHWRGVFMKLKLIFWIKSHQLAFSLFHIKIVRIILQQ